MSYLKEERPEIQTMIDLFTTIDKLNKIYSVDQSLDILDMYIKNGDEKVITPEYGIREFVSKSNIRNTFLPIYENGYNHLMDYIEDMYPSKKLSR